MISLESLSFFVIYTCAAVAAWLATYIVHSSLIIGGVWLMNRWRRPAREMQEAAWKLALVAGLATTTIAVATGLRPLGGRYDTAALVEASWRATPQVSSALRVLPIAVVSLWILYASFVLLRVASATTQARRSLGIRAEADDSTRELVARIAHHIGLHQRVRVTISEELVSPVVLGASEITLPRRVLEEFTPEEQRSVIGHELAHLARRDPRWLMLSATIEALFFFQVLNRTARMKWQEQSEYICDEIAVRAEGSRLPLARSLARVAEWSRGDTRKLLAPALAEQPSTLLGRVRQLLAGDPRVPATSRSPFVVFASLLMLLVLGGSPAFAPGSVRGWGKPAFHWAGVLAPGHTIEVQGVMGGIHAMAAAGDSVIVQATRRGRSTRPDIRFNVLRTGNGATVCVLYPTPAAQPANSCRPGARGQYNTKANDVAVEFVVQVPRGVGLLASSATGNITSTALPDGISAFTSSGNLTVVLAASDWTGVRELESKSGNIEVSLPRDANVAVTAATRTGTITSDFNIGQRHDPFLSRFTRRGSLGSSTRGVIGQGGRQLLLSTIAGNITIKAN